MRECLKVILGVLALTLGASAPTLIIEALHPGALVALNPPIPGSRNPQREGQANPAKHHDDSQDADQGSQNSPMLSDHQQSQNQYAVTAQPKAQRERESSAEWWVAFWTGALFIATTGLWFFTALLWWTTRHAVLEGQHAIKAAQRTATAANAHAAAAEEANKINREILIAANRPWIAVRMTIPKGEPLVFRADEMELKIKLSFKNIGNSPATEINLWAELYPDLVAANRQIENIDRDIRSIPQLGTRHGYILFPDHDFSYEGYVSGSIVEFRRSIAELNKYLQESAAAGQEAERADEGWPALVAAVWYKVPADRLPRHTIVVGEIKNTAAGKIGFDGSEGEFRDIEIVESARGDRRAT